MKYHRCHFFLEKFSYILSLWYSVAVISFLILLRVRHLTTLDDPLIRSKWMNVKKALLEESEIVKQLDTKRNAFKDTRMGRRPSSPPISTKSSFVFQPLDEYPTSSGAPSMDDPDVWRPPSRDTASRRSTRASQVGMRKSNQDDNWDRGPTRSGTTGRGAKAGSNRGNSGARSTTTTAGRKGNGSGKSNSGKADSVVSLQV